MTLTWKAFAAARHGAEEVEHVVDHPLRNPERRRLAPQHVLVLEDERHRNVKFVPGGRRREPLQQRERGAPPRAERGDEHVRVQDDLREHAVA